MTTRALSLGISRDLTIGVALALPIALLAVRYEETFLGVVLAVFWGLLCVTMLYRTQLRARQPMWLTVAVVGGFLVRVPLSLAHLGIGVLVYGGQVDFYGFYDDAIRMPGVLVAGDLKWESFVGSRNAASSVINLLYGLLVFLIGPSLPAMFLVSGVVGFFGSYFFFRAFRLEFPHARHLALFVACIFYFPTVAFWTSILGKDSWLHFFVGAIAYAFASLLRAFRAAPLLTLVACLTVVTMIRPPVGVTVTAAVAVGAFLAVRTRFGFRGPEAMLRPVVYVVSALIVAGGIFLASQGLWRYAAVAAEESLASGLLNLAVETRVGLATDPSAGGSSFAVDTDGGFQARMLVTMPMAISTFLFRPLLFEAHNALAFVAAIDSTVLLLLVLYRIRPLCLALVAAFRQPFIAFCLVAFLMLSAGLSFESNFGVIVRHRSMVLGFLFLLLNALPARTPEPAAR